jgi:biopolymer transport protein ExbB
MVKAALRRARDDEQSLRIALQDAALTEIPILERRINALAAIAQVAPLLGLLGTLIGLAKTFWLFNQGGEYATPSILAGGMWESLLAAIGGLVVAIPAHLARHFLVGRVQVLVNDMEWVGNEMLRILCVEFREGKSQPGATAGGPPARTEKAE